MKKRELEIQLDILRANGSSEEVQAKMAEIQAELNNMSENRLALERRISDEALNAELNIMQEILNSTETTEAERYKIKEKYMNLFK